MKIVYLNGPYNKQAYSRCSRSPAVTKSGTVYYPIWLAYAAGLAQKETSHQIELIDAIARKWDQDDLIAHFKNNQPDLVFCDTSTPSIHHDIATATAIKDAYPQTKVVMVGTHATALPDEVLAAEPRIDAIARGEYDQTAIELANSSFWSTIDGISYLDGNQCINNPDRPLMSDLDQLPFAAKIYQDFLNPNDYFFAAAQYPMIMTVTSRGCPHRCGWCLYPQVMHRGKYRMRSSDSVAAEFDYIAKEMPSIREIGIEDDLFTGDKNRLHDICEKLIKQNNKINFWCDTRVDLDYETMKLMKAAGCRLLIAGFESADQQILDHIKKGTSSEQAYTFMENARRAKLLVHGCFVLGNPGETQASMQATLDMAKILDPDTAQFFPMILYPGTRLYDWAKENDYLTTDDYSQWLTEDGLHNSIIDQPSIKANDVLNFCDTARREFYLRRKYIFKKITQSITDIHEAKRNVKAFRRFAQHLVKSV